MRRDQWEWAWQELARRKGRTAGNILGYVLAIGLVVVLIPVLLFAKQKANEILLRTGTHFTAFDPAGLPPMPSTTGELMAPVAPTVEGFIVMGVSSRLMPQEKVDAIRALPTVKQAAEFLSYRFRDPQGFGLLTVGGFNPDLTIAVGTTCCAATDIISGHFIDAQSRNQVMLEEAYAKAQNLTTGQTVTVAGTPFEVVGVVNPGIRPAKADIYMRLQDAQTLVNKVVSQPLSNPFNLVLIQTVSSALQEKAIKSVRDLGLTTSTYACYRPAAKVAGMNEAGIWLLSILVTLSAVLLALKTQLSTVLERRREIGILKAIGWTDRNVVQQILTESVLQAFTGGVLGCLLAFIILPFIPVKALAGVEADTPLSVPSLVMVGGLLLCLVGGVIAGVVPAIIAARQRPADALRTI